MTVKKSRLGALEVNVNNKLEHIQNIASSLQRDIREFYDSPDFIINDLPCLSVEFEEYDAALFEIKKQCNQISLKIVDEIPKSNVGKILRRKLREKTTNA